MRHLEYPSDGHGNLATGRWIGFVFILLVPLLGEVELEERGLGRATCSRGWPDLFVRHHVSCTWVMEVLFHHGAMLSCLFVYIGQTFFWPDAAYPQRRPSDRTSFVQPWIEFAVRQQMSKDICPSRSVTAICVPHNGNAKKV